MYRCEVGDRALALALARATRIAPVFLRGVLSESALRRARLDLVQNAAPTGGPVDVPVVCGPRVQLAVVVAALRERGAALPDFMVLLADRQSHVHRWG